MIRKSFMAMGLGMALACNMAAAADSSEPDPVTPTGNQGQGIIHFHGTIIDAPCSIDNDNANQTVELGQVANSALENGGESEAKSFDIKLLNCSAATAHAVTVTWGGEKDTSLDNALGITGNASGAGIVLKTENGTPVILGTPTTAQALIKGNNLIHMSAYLKGDGAKGGVVPGEFTSAASFVLAYQ